LERVIAAVVAEASRVDRRRVRRARNDASAPITSREGDTMEDVNRLKAALAQADETKRAELIAEAREKAAGAAERGVAEAAALAELDRIARAEAATTPARPDVLRDRLLEHLAETLDAPQEFPTAIAPTLECYANAANALDQIARRADAAAPAAPAINVERLAADVWNKIQEVDAEKRSGKPDAASICYASTGVADLAVEAIRRVLA
jgi:hypothetical protein